MKVNQQLKFNVPFPSLITRFAALFGVERRPTDRTSVYNSKQPFLPYGDFEGPPQKKWKTSKPTSAATESSAPPSAPAPFDGHDPGPPPPNTIEPEAEEPAPEEPTAEAGQVAQTPEHRAEEPIDEMADEPADHMIEEPVVVAELIAETASEPAGHTVEQPRAETTTQPSSAIIIYQRYHHPPPSHGGVSHG
ncbi:uncharacterized protein LOC127745581 [Arachis duranensis]|uniref:Uncharacterized protein LOC127745581 n=1 Tax=Arachis duranensis TaxID=130453 RepID=A0A9C6TD77_ARADU|nr:uncharacterized protein LOC127745581 [Arachis duranensis]